MATNLITPQSQIAIVECIYNDIVLRNSRYYYFISTPEEWNDEDAPDEPIDSVDYGKRLRNKIVFAKQIRPTDVSYVVPRIDWEANVAFDMYDDAYGTEIVGVNLTAGGSNYTSSANVSIDGDGTGAEATLVVSTSGETNGQVVSVAVTNRGYGYTTANVIIGNGGATGSGATAEAVLAVSDSGAVNLKDATFYVLVDESRVYKCLDNNNNALSTEIPTHTTVAPVTYADGYIWKYMYTMPSALKNRFLTANIMPVVTAISNRFYSNGSIGSVVIDDSGKNYYNANTSITVTGDGTNANLIAVVNGTGNIAAIQIDNAGNGYTYGSAVITSNTGSNAAITLNFSDGAINSLQGSNELLAVNGAIYAIKVTSGGYGYSEANVVIAGDGSGATATANITGSKITGITVTSPGSGYTFADITFVGDGVGAAARAILPPTGGHGKNPVKELYTRSFALSTVFSNETNQGFDIDSTEYRQVGIIRNPQQYDGLDYYKNLTGSTCWVLGGTFLATDYPVGTILTMTESTATFVVIAVANNSMLVHSRNGLKPGLNKFISNGTDTFTVTSITNPDVDKYSGELLYIDNRVALTPSAEQAVTLKTLFNF